MVEQHTHNTLRAAAARRRLLVVAAAGCVLMAALAAAMMGQEASAAIRMLALLISEVLHAWPAAVYLLAAFGLGRLASPLWAGKLGSGVHRESAACQLTCGLAMMLTISHLLGILGLLSVGPAVAVCAVGVALTVRQVLGPSRASPADLHKAGSRMPSWMWLSALPAAGVVVAAMAVPPGVLWSSEFGGFDVLSYHLQLPQEWVAMGRVWPVEHNVYSFLPSYVEAAYAHVAVMSFAPADEAFVGDMGWRMTSAKALHAGLWGCAAWLGARAAVSMLHRIGVDGRDAEHAGAVGGAFIAATPWTVVVGSMAYNEMAVLAMGAGGLVVASQEHISARARGALCGAIVGVAAGAKPSAALMIAPLVGIGLLALSDSKQWKAIVLTGLVAGIAAVAPWLVRNGLATGNPVFPFATGVFGTGHWTAEQAARWASAHHGQGSLLEQLGLLILPDPSAAIDAPATERHRGLSHPQWGLTGGVLALGSVLMLVPQRTRRLGIVLVGGGALALGVWLLLTHHQSRFLLPMALPAGLMLAVVCGISASLGGVGQIALGIGAVLALAQSGQTWRVWSDEGGGMPANLLGQGSAFFTGEAFSVEDRVDLPRGFARLAASDLGGAIYLLGESTPMYWPPASVYHTTWDDGPMSEAMRTHPDEPERWVEALKERRIAAVMVNAGELARLEMSGWLGPELSASNVAEVLGRLERVRTWPGRGLTLYAVRPQMRETGAGTSP